VGRVTTRATYCGESHFITYWVRTGNGSTTLTGQMGFTGYTAKKVLIKKIEHLCNTYILTYVLTGALNLLYAPT
jgi:hypothetical protein